MSEHVMIGGIGKSPAIDKIHRFSSKGLKQKIVKKMEEQMLIKYTDSLKKYTDRIPIKFKKANWKGTLYGNKEERYALAKKMLCPNGRICLHIRKNWKGIEEEGIGKMEPMKKRIC